MNDQYAQIREWILSTSRSGHDIQDLLDMMVQTGYNPQLARRLMAETLDRPAIAIPVADKRDDEPVSDGKRTRHPEPPFVTVGKHRIDVPARMEKPTVRVLESIITEAECNELIEAARPRLKRSRTVTDEGTHEVSSARTSSGMFFSVGETETVTRVENRISELLDIPLDHGEGLQILHYEPGQQYEPHYDWFDPSQPGYESLTNPGGERIASLIMYLNTPEQGGGTHFPRVDMTVAARKGSAVYFAYRHGDTSSLHAGLPVEQGEKWIATKWIREYPYR